MSATQSQNSGEMIYCRDCGEKIREEAEICPECGIRQKGSGVGGDVDLDQYSTAAWIVGIIVAILTFPLGLVIPAYFYIKAKRGEGADQGGWETWTVIFWGIIGIVAVEIGGEKGAKALWVLLGGLILFIIFAAILGAFVLGLGGAA